MKRRVITSHYAKSLCSGLCKSRLVYGRVQPGTSGARGTDTKGYAPKLPSSGQVLSGLGIGESQPEELEPRTQNCSELGLSLVPDQRPGFKALGLFETRKPKVKQGSTVGHFRGKFQGETSTMLGLLKIVEKMVSLWMFMA